MRAGRLAPPRHGRVGATQLLHANTLDAMWLGGIHDHVGGGFHRYSTDERWFLPQFEKMLYDNAQLMIAYAEGYRLTDKPRYRREVEDIFAWHLYGDNPDADFLVPTRASMAVNDAFEAGETEVPEAVLRQNPVFEKPLRLYEKTVTFRIPVTVRSAATPGETVLRVELHAQPCDDTRCLSPRTQTLEVPVTITTGDVD